MHRRFESGLSAEDIGSGGVVGAVLHCVAGGAKNIEGERGQRALSQGPFGFDPYPSEVVPHEDRLQSVWVLSNFPLVARREGQATLDAAIGV